MMVSDPTLLSLASLSMDLKRVSLGWYRGSPKMADQFLKEAKKRRNEVNPSSVSPYIRKLLRNLGRLEQIQDTAKKAEDALMYSILLKNYTTYTLNRISNK